jgi:hypothetical protein
MNVEALDMCTFWIGVEFIVKLGSCIPVL